MVSSSTIETDPGQVGFITHVLTLPLAKTVLQIYEQMKASSTKIFNTV